MATERAPLSASAAQLWAWGFASGLAVVSALFQRGKSLSAFIGSLGLDVSQHLAVGVLVFGLVYTWQRFVPARGSLWVAPVALLSAVLTDLAVADDLEGIGTKLTFIPLPAAARVHLLAVLLSLTVPLAAFVGSRLSFAALAQRSTRLRWLPVGCAVLGALVLLAHPRLLDQNYPGIHLVGTVVGTLFVGACLTGLRVPIVSNRLRLAVLVPLALIGVAAIAIRPRDRWTVVAMRRTSAVFVPYVARLQEGDGGGNVAAKLHDDSAMIPPTSPPLIARPTVIFWTVDAVRPELFQGENCERLKNLCQLQAESITFSHARSAAPATTASLTSLFTGRYYSQIYWDDATTPFGAERLFPHKDPSVRFPQLLTDAGVHTINTSGHAGYAAEFGVVTGFAEELSEGKTAKDIAKLTIKQLKLQRQLFVYAHLLEPHSPYKGQGKTPFEKYVGDVAMVDEQLGLLREAIAKSKRASSTILIISADHGEAFGEHGANYHGSTVYDEMVRIPLMVHIPGRAPRVIDEAVSLVDLGPTILDLFGQPTPGSFMGSSLVPLLAGGAEPLERPIIVDSSRWRQAMVFPDGYKVVHDQRARTSELYDTNADPGEADDLSDAQPDLLNERLGALRAFMSVHTLKRSGYKKPYRK